jgi:hypothetical protein
VDILLGKRINEMPVSSDRMAARVTCMTMIKNDPAYLVAGDEDGVVRIWDAG